MKAKFQWKKVFTKAWHPDSRELPVRRSPVSGKAGRGWEGLVENEDVHGLTSYGEVLSTHSTGRAIKPHVRTTG